MLRHASYSKMQKYPSLSKFFLFCHLTMLNFNAAAHSGWTDPACVQQSLNQTKNSQLDWGFGFDWTAPGQSTGCPCWRWTFVPALDLYNFFEALSFFCPLLHEAQFFAAYDHTWTDPPIRAALLHQGYLFGVLDVCLINTILTQSASGLSRASWEVQGSEIFFSSYKLTLIYTSPQLCHWST